MSRQIILDTETTGLETAKGHRIIEIGAIEMHNRQRTGNHFHRYINPQRLVEKGAMMVHGISDQFLADKPLFKDIIDEFMAYISGAELVIHNASFDLGFIDHELKLLGSAISSVLDIVSGCIDTLAMARKKYPGKKNNLDALCQRCNVDLSGRELHGALKDANLLADVYLAMTGGQLAMFADDQKQQIITKDMATKLKRPNANLLVLNASHEEMHAHLKYLELLRKNAGGKCLWDG